MDELTQWMWGEFAAEVEASFTHGGQDNLNSSAWTLGLESSTALPAVAWRLLNQGAADAFDDRPYSPGDFEPGPDHD